MPIGGAVLSAAREVQIPLLAALLIGACAAKVQRAVRARSMSAALGPPAMFPLRLRRPASVAICAGELALGTGLIVTAGRAGAGIPATTVRLLAALLFGIAVAALNELRSRNPDAGCGCFGDLSEAPVSARTIARSALLCAGAIASAGVPPLHRPASTGEAGLLLATGTAELLLLAALSPEVGELMVRLGYAEPCAVRPLPVERTLAALRASVQWRRFAGYLSAPEPTDIWREGCWRFAVFGATIADREVDVIFAVYVQRRRPPIRVAVLDAVPGAVYGTGPAATPRPVPVRAPATTVAPVAPVAPAPRFVPVPSFTPVIPIFIPAPNFVPAARTMPASTSATTLTGGPALTPALGFPGPGPVFRPRHRRESPVTLFPEGADAPLGPPRTQPRRRP